MDTIKSLLHTGKIKEALVKFRALPEAEQEDVFKEMAPTLFPPPIFGVLFRKLHPGKTYEDFHEAWLPPLKEGQDLAHYFPYPTYVLSGENKDNPSDIITIGFMWIEEENINEVLESTKKTENQRHDKINTVAEKIGPSLIYKLKNVTKLGGQAIPFLMKVKDIKNLTPHKDVNDILVMLSEGLQDILAERLVGIYLTGSLTYGDFNRGSSDIDFLIILRERLNESQREKVKDLHAEIANKYPFWAKRIEASYITEDMLKNAEPPKQPRPYINGGQMWDPDPPYGNEWLINLYVLYECGVALYGPDPKTLIGHPIDIEMLRNASRNDLHQDWEPLLKDPSPLEDPHFQAYTILTLCRILYRAKNDDVASKKVALTWVKTTYGERWSPLLIQAENWSHGDEMNETNEVLKFIEFVVEEVG